MYFLFALAGHRGTCLRPLHIFALPCRQATLKGVSVDVAFADVNWPPTSLLSAGKGATTNRVDGAEMHIGTRAAALNSCCCRGCCCLRQRKCPRPIS